MYTEMVQGQQILMFYSGPQEWRDYSKTENGDYKSDTSFMRENRLYDYNLHLLDSHHAASRKVMGRVCASLRAHPLAIYKNACTVQETGIMHSECMLFLY